MICEHCKIDGTEHRSTCPDYKPMCAPDRRAVSWIIGAYGLFVLVGNIVMWGKL